MSFEKKRLRHMLEKTVDSVAVVNDTLSEGRAQTQMLEFLVSDLSLYPSPSFPPPTQAFIYL